MALEIVWQPKQRVAWNWWDDRTTTRLGIGGARGGTKSGFLRRGLIARRYKYPNTTGLLLRRTLPDLERSHLLKLFEEFPELRRYYNEQKKKLTLPNGSVQFFASAPTAKDVAKFYSAEFADIGLDEAQEFSQDEIERIGGSNRCTSNPDILPIMVFSFMPGLSESGIPPKGLPYLRRTFVKGQLRNEETQHKWKFMQAFAWDNIEWARGPLARDGVSDKQYYAWSDKHRREYFLTRTVFGAQLSGLTNKALRDAWLEGSWDAFQGQMFPNFDNPYGRHTADAADVFKKIKPWWEFWVSGDWGSDHPACYHLHARGEDKRVYTLCEIWGREMGESLMGQRIGQMCRRENLGFKPGPLETSAFPLSWDAFGKLNKLTRRSIVEMIGQALPQHVAHPYPADATAGSRISGWRFMSELIDNDLWTVCRESSTHEWGTVGCPKLIECIPTLVRDMERNSEDVLKVDYSENYIGDDPADCARYGLQHMLEAADKPREVQAQERFEEIEQMTDQYGHPLSPTAVMMRQRLDKPAEPHHGPWRIGGK